VGRPNHQPARPQAFAAHADRRRNPAPGVRLGHRAHRRALAHRRHR
jgi:hypothetical protein